MPSIAVPAPTGSEKSILPKVKDTVSYSMLSKGCLGELTESICCLTSTNMTGTDPDAVDNVLQPRMARKMDLLETAAGLLSRSLRVRMMYLTNTNLHFSFRRV